MEHNLLQPLYETLKRLGNTEKVVSWRYKGWLTKKLTASTTTGNSFLRSVNQYGDSSFCLIFKGSYLKHKKAIFTPPNRINVVIIHKLDTWSQDLNSDFTLKDCLFEGVKLAKYSDPGKYIYSGYGIGFDSRSKFSLPDGSVGKSFIIFGIDMNSFVHIDNKKKDILILSIDPKQGSDNTALTAEARY